MKVFLSWSGPRSHKIALVLRDWLPSVIQEIVPYVSSEDIDKGTRWSSDIAKELEDSTFGIICVTKENITAPWLSFEAGALSKTMDKSFVSPFLFDIKRSEVHGPILQFQSTIFEKGDILKLVNTLNKACDKDRLSSERLAKAFEVWYPTLESELSQIQASDPDEDLTKADGALHDSHTQDVLEEILDLSRNNLKLLRNPEGFVGHQLEETKALLKECVERMDRREFINNRPSKKFHPLILEELLSIATGKLNDPTIGLQMIFAMLKDEYPWLYDIGIETIRLLRSDAVRDDKARAIESLVNIVDLSFNHPLFREKAGKNKDWMMLGREIPYLLSRLLDEKIQIH